MLNCCCIVYSLKIQEKDLAYGKISAFSLDVLFFLLLFCFFFFGYFINIIVCVCLCLQLACIYIYIHTYYLLCGRRLLSSSSSRVRVFINVFVRKQSGQEENRKIKFCLNCLETSSCMDNSWVLRLF